MFSQACGSCPNRRPQKRDGLSKPGGTLFFTDDVALFSATRRLGRDGDPTQPAIDSKLTDQGSDVVFDPMVDITRSLTNNPGQLDLNVKGEGVFFTENPEFTHGTLRLQATQALSSTTRVQARFSYAPNQFLGNNEESQSGQELVMAEKLTGYIWSTCLIHDVTPDLSVHLFGRYGLRRYNEAFSERNMDFWTIGPHVEWRVAPKVKLGLSYHYERGLAEGRTQPQFEDDMSYINHYLSAADIFQHPAITHTDRGTRCTAPALIAATTTEPVSRPSSSLAPLVITARRRKPQSTVIVTNTPCGSISVTRPDR